MKICNFCRVQILESNSLWGKHQDSYEGYKLSAVHAACVFCKKIVEEVLDNTKWQSVLSYRSPLQQGRPMYRWTFRKTAKIREMPDSFIITFREIPTSMGEKPKDSLAGLPDLTFYMLCEQGVPYLPIPLVICLLAFD